MDEQEDKENFDNLINDLQHHHNDNNDSVYALDDSDWDDNSLGSLESEYSVLDEEEGILVTYDDIVKEGGILDHRYGINESTEK